MGARGSKPVGELRMAGFSDKRSAYPCPRNLGKDGRALWRKIVSAYPADYFRAGDIPLLQAYCQEWERHEKAHRMLLEEGEVITNERDVTKRNPWHDVLVASSNAMCQIATKLRLCANSRMSYEKSASAGDMKPAARSRAGLMFGDEGRMQ